MALLAAVPGACGFEPIYGRGGDTTSGLGDELAAVAVPDATDRLTFELRQQLVDQLNPTGVAVVPRYRLDWRIVRDIEDLAIQLDAVVTRQDLTLAASYALIDLEEDVVVDRGRVLRRASFNIIQDPYNDLVAEEDANRRAASALAVALRQQLVAYFERSAA